MKRLLLLFTMIQCLTALTQREKRFVFHVGAGYSIPFVGKINEQPHQLDKYVSLLKPGPGFTIQFAYLIKNNLALGACVNGSGFNLDQARFAEYINQTYPNSHIYGNGTYYSSDYLGSAPKSRSFTAHVQYHIPFSHFTFNPSFSLGVRYLTDPRISYLVRPDSTYLFSTYTFSKNATVNPVGCVGFEFGFKKLPAFTIHSNFEFGFVGSYYNLTIKDPYDVLTSSKYGFRNFLGTFSFGLSLCLDEAD